MSLRFDGTQFMKIDDATGEAQLYCVEKDGSIRPMEELVYPEVWEGLDKRSMAAVIEQS